MDKTRDGSERRHFLVVAASARGARFFVKNALLQGHSVTALCRAADAAAALARMEELLAGTTLTEGGLTPAGTPGKLTTNNSNIFKAETFKRLLTEDPSIDALCCFVGISDWKQMFKRENTLYTSTISAMVEGMRQSRWVETFYHGSSGSEGTPGQHRPELPANFRPRCLLNLFFKLPVLVDYMASEGLLADAKGNGCQFIIFRPAFLTSKPAKRAFGRSRDTTGMDKPELPLRLTTMEISREDVAEEILRLATLPPGERADWHGHGVYLADMKEGVSGNDPRAPSGGWLGGPDTQSPPDGAGGSLASD